MPQGMVRGTGFQPVHTVLSSPDALLHPNSLSFICVHLCPICGEFFSVLAVVSLRGFFVLFVSSWLPVFPLRLSLRLGVSAVAFPPRIRQQITRVCGEARPSG